MSHLNLTLDGENDVIDQTCQQRYTHTHICQTGNHFCVLFEMAHYYTILVEGVHTIREGALTELVRYICQTGNHFRVLIEKVHYNTILVEAVRTIREGALTEFVRYICQTGNHFREFILFTDLTLKPETHLEQKCRQYKNNSGQSKKMQTLKLPRHFTRLWLKKRGNFKTCIFFDYPVSFWYCLYSRTI